MGYRYRYKTFTKIYSIEYSNFGLKWIINFTQPVWNIEKRSLFLRHGSL